jgi:hypothetical protein
MLHHVLKELASKRLAADQRNFAQVHASEDLATCVGLQCHTVCYSIDMHGKDPACHPVGVLRQ